MVTVRVCECTSGPECLACVIDRKGRGCACHGLFAKLGREPTEQEIRDAGSTMPDGSALPGKDPPMSADRDGPTLTVVGSCEGCAHLRSEYYCIEDGNDVDSGFANTCAHPDGKRDRMYGNTPAWCPRLPAARVALGRELVKEGGTPAKADDRWYGGFIAALTTIVRYPAGMTAKGIMQEHGVTIADLRESEQGVPQEIDDIEASK